MDTLSVPSMAAVRSLQNVVRPSISTVQMPSRALATMRRRISSSARAVRLPCDWLTIRPIGNPENSLSVTEGGVQAVGGIVAGSTFELISPSGLVQYQ